MSWSPRMKPPAEPVLNVLRRLFYKPDPIPPPMNRKDRRVRASVQRRQKSLKGKSK